MKNEAMTRQIRYLKGVGPARAKRFGRLGIETVGDLLLHVPRRYVDRRHVASIASLRAGQEAVVAGTVAHTRFSRSRQGRRIFHATLTDGTGSLDLTFFHADYLSRRLRPGVRVSASGEVRFFGGRAMAHPDLVFLDANDEEDGSQGVVPVYPLTEGIGPRTIVSLVGAALEEVGDEAPMSLPGEVLQARGFHSGAEVLRAVHRPDDPKEGLRARETLALEDLYIYQQMLSAFRSGRRIGDGVPVPAEPEALEEFTGSLPFSLTGAQSKALGHLSSDMDSRIPMRRLLQGDVGSGKTVVAAALCWLAHRAGLQSAVLAPTEVLASQHMRSLEAFMEGLNVGCGLLTGSTPAAERERLAGALEAGDISLLVGTHAVLEGSVPLDRLGLLVVDEQHKFGVQQRESLLVGRRPRPHLMVMSATPIPRTMAMTLYGDMDLAVLDEMPPGRGRITTRVMHRERRGKIFDFLLGRLEKGERAFIVYPLREASEHADLRDATSAYEILRDGPLGRFGVSLLHGSMSGPEKVAATDDFAFGRTAVLVSTTVIEVGIDVPEATVMVVSGAERFGLSQLHQLRGRIGRGGRNSWCFLVHGDRLDQTAWERLRILAATTDGFRIAEKDLELRGPGEVIGTRQHGVPAFPVADLERDMDLLTEARRLAEAHPEPPDLEELFEHRFGRSSPLPSAGRGGGC